MNKIYKLSLLSYFFFSGCAQYTPDFMAAYVYACNVEISKHKKEHGNIDAFKKRLKLLEESHDKIKTLLNTKAKDKLSSFEKSIISGDVNKRFKQFDDFISQAFTDVTNYDVNGSVRDFAAYACLSQTIFNILMYAFSSLDDAKAMKILNIVCNVLKFLKPRVVVEALILCENFYEKESFSNFNQELLETVNNLVELVKKSADSGALTCVNDLEFTPEEGLTLISTLVFLLNHKHFFKIEDNSPSLRSLL